MSEESPKSAEEKDAATNGSRVRSFLTRLLVSLLIGGGMLYLALKNIDLSKVQDELGAAQWKWLVPYFLAMVAQHYFRASRWSHLLAPIVEVPFSRILPIASVGFLAIVALPLRMGEFVRPYLIADPPRVRMSHGLGTMAVERVFDGLVLSLMCFLVVAEAQRRPEVQVPNLILFSGWAAFGLFFSVLVALIMALWKKDQAVTLCRRMFSIISPKVGDKLAGIAEGIVDGFKVLPNPKHLLMFLFGTLSYWLLNGLAVWILSYSFGLDLSPWQGISVMVIVGIGIMVPAGPGFIGNFEYFASSALLMYGKFDLVGGKKVVWPKGMAYIFAFHATNALWYAVTGAIAMFSSQVTFKKVWRATAGDADSSSSSGAENGSSSASSAGTDADAEAESRTETREKE